MEPPPKRRRGGQRQRLAAFHEAHVPTASKNSFLADMLLEKWSWGQISPQEVQQFAAMACKDFEQNAAQPPCDLQFLASLGTSGVHKNNMHRQLLQWGNGKCPHMVQAFHATFTFKPPYNNQMQSLLLPHELFHHIYWNYKQAWNKIILPSVDSLKEFWKLQKNHPAYSTVQGLAAFQTKLIPFALHGDGTPVIGIGKIWSRQLTIFSFNSMLGLGSTKDQQIHIWSFFDETKGDTTLDQFWALLGWSLTWLRKGVWPDQDHLGHKYLPTSEAGKRALTPLAEGYAAVVWSLVGDLEYLNSVLQLPHYANKTNPCALCRCSGGTDSTSWKHCGLKAEWLNLQWSPSEYLGHVFVCMF